MITVLITGGGGAAVPGLIEKLRGSGYRVLAADMDQHAVGLYLADAGFIIPNGKSPDFLQVIRHICRQEGVDVLVPLVDEELVAALELESEGIIVLLPRREFVTLCLDKFLLMQSLRAADITVPETHLASNRTRDMDFPLVIKPCTGRGSRGLGIVDSQEELEHYLQNSPYETNALIIQEYIQGIEFTVSVVVWRDGEVQAVVPKEIIFKKGITRLAVTRRNLRIEKLCCAIQDNLSADGPFNVQLRVDQNTGQPIPFEINPRFSTTTSLTIAAGIDEFGGLITQAVQGRNEYHFGDWQEGVVLLRRTLDEFIDESTFRSLELVNLAKGIQ